MFVLILLLIIIAIVAIFLIQNATPVAVSFLFWRFEGSLAVVLFLSVIAGATISAAIFYSLKLRKLIRK